MQITKGRGTQVHSAGLCLAGRRRWWETWPAGMALAGTALVATLAAAGCSSPPATSGTAAGGTAANGTVASQLLIQGDRDLINFARCMRAHGVQMFDPYHRPGHLGLAV